MKRGNFVISLDFELIWGVFDVVNIEREEQYFRTTRKVIPRILSLFKKYDIHATWAVVGMMFNRNWDDWEINIPSSIPAYQDPELSSYSFAKKWIGNTKFQDIFFAPRLIAEIANTPYQEIATHTYSHYYCLEPGQSIKEFESDLAKAVHMAKREGFELKSLVFPRNQLSPEYLKICSKWGIKNVRSNPESWYWKNPNSKNLLVRVFRTLDAYINIGRKTYGPENSSLLTLQKASRFFRPYENSQVLRNLKLNRIKEEMALAAEKGEVYHLWWHPHNFGNNSEKSLEDLEIILSYYSLLEKKYHFQSRNMEELGILFNDQKTS